MLFDPAVLLPLDLDDIFMNAESVITQAGQVSAPEPLGTTLPSRYGLTLALPHHRYALLVATTTVAGWIQAEIEIQCIAWRLELDPVDRHGLSRDIALACASIVHEMLPWYPSGPRTPPPPEILEGFPSGMVWHQFQIDLPVIAAQTAAWNTYFYEHSVPMARVINAETLLIHRELLTRYPLLAYCRLTAIELIFERIVALGQFAGGMVDEAKVEALDWYITMMEYDRLPPRLRREVDGN